MRGICARICGLQHRNVPYVLVVTFLVDIRSHELVNREPLNIYVTILQTIFPCHMSNSSTNSAFVNTYVFIIVFMPMKLGSPFAFLWYDYLGSLVCV